MDWREGVRMAVRAIAGHRLRSALTVVGIVIGIATVIAFASFGASVQTDVVGEFQSTSASEVYIVSGGGFLSGGGPPGADVGLTTPVVTTHDLEQLRAIDGTRAVLPRGSVPISSLTYANQTVTPGSLTATTAAALDGEIVAGRAFESGTNEIVLNEIAAAQFDSNVTVGDRIEVAREGTTSFTVVGITAGARGGFSELSAPGPEFYVPVDPHYRTTQASPAVGVDQRAYSQVTIVADAGRVSEVRDAVEAYIQTESDARQLAGEDGQVTVQSTEDVVGGIQAVLQDITRLITGIGVLALIVGAFGIANIMLVSVTERTKEIGIMKSMGATNREILGLFLAESVLLGSLGAVIGIPLGLGVGYAGSAYAEVGFTIPVDWVVIAIAMGITIGVVAGLYPAWRAARVDPIEALRYE
ncbi:ABC transporter permease [Halorhabdus sp. BNX81]|uniref:ABC transporter permease n=1 Tax=Halorhabdus sp. BNX81 TaxID=2980181 RepID=UPI0023DCF30B|nr:ABC transporter permease [Halorhabdus sp. BNX81]WEL22591.1 ABC-type antimicrobial peptide transport system,permease component [Halorhabdus sp. BNX81]